MWRAAEHKLRPIRSEVNGKRRPRPRNTDRKHRRSLRDLLKLGLTSFGGPIAHLGYFRNEIVQRRRWIDEKGYADLVTLCQFLPGPASSQLGFALGLLRAGALGALAAWTAFTLPSAILLVVFAFGAAGFGGLPVRASSMD
jgi:putative chromate ion transporter